MSEYKTKIIEFYHFKIKITEFSHNSAKSIEIK